MDYSMKQDKEGKMKEMKHESHKSQFKFEY